MSLNLAHGNGYGIFVSWRRRDHYFVGFQAKGVDHVMGQKIGRDGNRRVRIKPMRAGGRILALQRGGSWYRSSNATNECRRFREAKNLDVVLMGNRNSFHMIVIDCSGVLLNDLLVILTGLKTKYIVKIVGSGQYFLADFHSRGRRLSPWTFINILKFPKKCSCGHAHKQIDKRI